MNKQSAMRLGNVLLAALRDQPQPGYDLLLLNQGIVVAKYEHAAGQLRGFAWFDGKLWTIDSRGVIYQVTTGRHSVQLLQFATSPLAFEAHDLAVIDGQLATAATAQNAIVFYNPETDQWSIRRPWIPLGESNRPLRTGETGPFPKRGANHRLHGYCGQEQ